ncbi:MAG: TetR/AcrR family transcriptional regulator [Robiginitomaculum sp.]|nr:TetR/AcrR family transcriptional regulator [Robiginitomaculum sp.]
MAQKKIKPIGTRKAKSDIRNKIFDFKREQILEVSERLFYHRGFQATTLDIIAEELGVTKPFIYYHFKNKRSILLHLLERTMGKYHDVFAGVDVESGKPEVILKDLVQRFTLVVIETRVSTAMFWRDEKDLPLDRKEKIRDMKRDVDNKLTRVIERGIDDGIFDVKDPKMASLCVAGMVTWTYTWYQADGRSTPDEIADRMTEYVLNMVGIRK